VADQPATGRAKPDETETRLQEETIKNLGCADSKYQKKLMLRQWNIKI
jgi:hypothetical protein